MQSQVLKRGKHPLVLKSPAVLRSAPVREALGPVADSRQSETGRYAATSPASMRWKVDVSTVKKRTSASPSMCAFNTWINCEYTLR
jgi:hypothetical protein